MNILIIEPFFTGSHKTWMLGYQKYSQHTVEFLTLPGRHWKWRMHGAAVTLANQFLDKKPHVDLILFTDMLDVATFLALTRSVTANIPTAIYFHENQLTYPKSARDSDITSGRDDHYAFINFTSALSCDQVFFNSQYHLTSFLAGLRKHHKKFPDYNELGSIDFIEDKSQVLYLGLDLERLNKPRSFPTQEEALILWNHRWEYDKNPNDFFKAITILANRGLRFKIAVLGEQFSESPAVFNAARHELKDYILQFGYTESPQEYTGWLWRSTLLPVTSNQDFFGASIMEAVFCNTIPILPGRLTYPELLPEILHEKLIYDGFDDLLNKLEYYIINPDKTISEISTVASRFDWSVLATEYDEVFEGMI